MENLLHETMTLSKKGQTFLCVIHFIPIPESCDISQNDFDKPMQLNCQTVKSGELGAVK